MKAKSAYLADGIADDIDRIADANRMSSSRVLGIAAELLVEEVRKTGRLPLPPVEFAEAAPVAAEA